MSECPASPGTFCYNKFILFLRKGNASSVHGDNMREDIPVRGGMTETDNLCRVSFKRGSRSAEQLVPHDLNDSDILVPEIDFLDPLSAGIPLESRPQLTAQALLKSKNYLPSLSCLPCMKAYLSQNLFISLKLLSD